MFCFVWVFETESHYVTQVGLEFTILLPHPLSAGLTRRYHHT
jgi:hypothetical protein